MASYSFNFGETPSPASMNRAKEFISGKTSSSPNRRRSTPNGNPSGAVVASPITDSYQQGNMGGGAMMPGLDFSNMVGFARTPAGQQSIMNILNRIRAGSRGNL